MEKKNPEIPALTWHWDIGRGRVTNEK